MPWQVSGVFERNNGANQGDNLWQTDRSQSVKIEALRHDTHDEDLALGIAACLNLDGYNDMRATLGMGGFAINNLGRGTLATQAARRDDVISGASFDGPSRDLTLSRDSGLDPIVVNIPDSGGGGGGSGTVTSIDIGEGLSGTPDPITTTGVIELPTLITAQTVAGPIDSITLDKHGRVTAISAGGTLNTNLGTANRTANTLDITSSTGNDVTIPAATQSLSGLMTAQDKIDLANAAAGGGANLSTTTFTGSVRINSDSGSDATIAAANGSAAGVMSTTLYDQLQDAVLDGDFGGTGLMVRTGIGTYANRQIIGGSGINVADQDGVIGNPTISVAYNVTISASAPSGGSNGDLWFQT